MVWSISVLGCKHFPPLGSSGKKEHALARLGETTGKQFLSTWSVDPWGNDSWLISLVANMKNCILTVWEYLCIFGPFPSADGFLAQPWMLLLSSKISNLSLSFLPLGHCGLWSYQRKAGVKVCSWGILCNSTIFRWQILEQTFFSHHTKIFKALWNWKSPREYILWKKILNLVTKNYMGYIKLLHQSTKHNVENRPECWCNLWKRQRVMCKVLQQQRMGSCITSHCYERVQFEMICKIGNLWFGWEKGNELPGCPISVTLGLFLRKAQNRKLAHDCICKWKRKSKETFSMQNFLFRNKNVNNNVTWKIIALHLNMHRNTQCPAVSTAWLLPFPQLPFVPSPFALTLYMAVMLMSSTEVSPSHLGIPSAGTEQSHRLLSLSADIKSKDHTQR